MMKMYSSILFLKKALPPPPHVFTLQLYKNADMEVIVKFNDFPREETQSFSSDALSPQWYCNDKLTN